MYLKIILISLFAAGNFCGGLSISSQNKNEKIIDFSNQVVRVSDTTSGIVYFSFDNAVS